MSVHGTSESLYRIGILRCLTQEEDESSCFDVLLKEDKSGCLCSAISVKVLFHYS